MSERKIISKNNKKTNMDEDEALLIALLVIKRRQVKQRVKNANTKPGSEKYLLREVGKASIIC